jgi:phosphogluconate dehydratase
MTARNDIQAITERIRERSKVSREIYLDRVNAAAGKTANRGVLSCGNLAHGFAVCSPSEKVALAATRSPISASSPPTTTCCRRISRSRPIRS